MDNELTFGQWHKRRRRGLGLTQRSLGQQVGYASETIRKVEADELRPSRQMVERLAEALQIEPAERARFVRFARDEPEGDEHALSTLTVGFPPDAPPAPRRHSLPAALTTIIGREKEIAEIQHLLSTRRLVTLTGAGGLGKSRLAIEAASGLADGVWLVALAPLAGHLHGKALLLVLDNCEHLIEACAQAAKTARLLASAAAQRAAEGYALLPVDQAETDEAVAALRAALGEAAFAAAWADGAAMTVEAGAAYALEE